MFKNIYDKYFPVIKVKTQYRNHLPWLSSGLKLSIKYKNELHRISIKHPTSYNINAYKVYKNKLTSILQEAEKVYYQTEIISYKSNLRKVWAIIKQVINKTKTPPISDKFIHNKTLISDPVSIANCFNNYFVNIGPTLASKLPKENISHRDFLPEMTTASLFLEPTDEVETKKIIRNLKEGAPGQDGITANNIKCITDHIASSTPPPPPPPPPPTHPHPPPPPPPHTHPPPTPPPTPPLTHIGNISFEQGIFP